MLFDDFSEAVAAAVDHRTRPRAGQCRQCIDLADLFFHFLRRRRRHKLEDVRSAIFFHVN